MWLTIADEVCERCFQHDKIVGKIANLTPRPTDTPLKEGNKSVTTSHQNQKKYNPLHKRTQLM